MKKLTPIIITLAYLISTKVVFGQTTITIQRPQFGFTDIGKFIQNVLTLAFIAGVIAVLVMLVWGGVEWITSGGDKEGLSRARSRIIQALVGLAILAVAFAIFVIASNFLGFGTVTPQGGTFTIPAPQ